MNFQIDLRPAAFAVPFHHLDLFGEDFGLRWLSAAATPLLECVDTVQSGVALRFPPQSKKVRLPLRRAGS